MPVRKNKSKSRRHTKKQRGGSPSVAYTGDTFMAAGGAPFEVRTAQDSQCVGSDSMRPAPMTGGGCGCMMKGGAYYSQLSNEYTGKMLDGPVRYACPQMGGGSHQLINSYQSGYSLDQPVAAGGAHYMDYQSYGRNCMGGGRRSKKQRRNRSKKSRRH